MPYRKEDIPEILLPHLTVCAVLYEEGKPERTVYRSLPPIPEETVSIPLPHIAAHVEVKDYDHYHIKAEVQSTRLHSLAYDGRTVRIEEDEPLCVVFSYPSAENPSEEIKLILRVIRTPGGGTPSSEKIAY